ncbi:MAG TPA: proliferating cell nuclear antigen (pcna) [Candidatus Nanoarchaeia archaeon]|nr:proliferating cell nuclear antigen (pcna) [Candidatus Nanoarchaeia archaeon]
MKLTLAEPKYLKDSVSIISDLVTEAKFIIKKDGLELIAMDPANVAMVIFRLLSTCFTEYDVKQTVEIPINLTQFKQVLRRANSNDMVTLEYEDAKLKIQFQSDTVRTFSLPAIELDEKEQRVPELNFPVSIETSSSVLSEAVGDVEIVAESVTFQSDKLKFIVAAEGDLSKARIEIPTNDVTKITSKNDSVRAKYSVEYLKKMIEGSKISDKVTIQFSNDYPLRLDYKQMDKVSLSFILAPRVEND